MRLFIRATAVWTKPDVLVRLGIELAFILLG